MGRAMIQVDMKSLLNKLNSFCVGTLENAAGLCISRTHYEVAVEHFFLKTLEDPNSDVPLILRRFEIDPSRLVASLTEALEDFKSGNASKPVFSPLLMELLQSAWLISSVDLGESVIRSGTVVLSFLAKPQFFAAGRYSDLLSRIGSETLKKEFWSIVKGSTEHRTPIDETRGKDVKPKVSGTGFIERFCNDFTAQAQAGKIDPVFGRDSEIRKIVDILARRRKNNPILVGEPGVGKTAVIEGLALRIFKNDVPDMLRGTTLLGLDMGALEAGAGMKGEFENRLKGVLGEIKSSEKPIILFVDEAHTLVGAGGTAGGGDAANLLKPALARGELRTCAATTWSEYKKYFEKDPALARRFQLVALAEPDVETTTLILRGLKKSYEASHRVVVQDEAIQAASELSDRYISGRFLPDKAIDLLDTGCARIKINLSAKPAGLEDEERTIQALERQKNAMQRDQDHGHAIDIQAFEQIAKDIQTHTENAQKIEAQWKIEQEAANKLIELRANLQNLEPNQPDQRTDLVEQIDTATKKLYDLHGESPLVQVDVTPDVVAQVVADWTGIPVGKMLRDQAQTVIHLEDHLKKRIKGQDNALGAIAEGIRSAKAGIKNPNSPTGVYLLVGPSGVGKTECGLAIAEQLFGGERNVVTINMSEFQERHTISRLIGSPPGYVGFGEGGMLTEAVRQRPYSVVLLDEVEKAHLDVMNLFYQVFDKGTLMDGEGKEINFRNTVMILTSNLATDVIHEMTSSDETPPLDSVVSAIRPILSQHFKPALLARMTIVPFNHLNPEAMQHIVELKLEKLRQTLDENNQMSLTYSPAVVEQIAARCTEVETGARNIEYILSGNVLPQISRAILSHLAEGSMPSGVGLDVGEDGAFQVEFNQADKEANP